jgi:hypothetical protein
MSTHMTHLGVGQLVLCFWGRYWGDVTSHVPWVCRLRTEQNCIPPHFFGPRGCPRPRGSRGARDLSSAGKTPGPGADKPGASSDPRSHCAQSSPEPKCHRAVMHTCRYVGPTGTPLRQSARRATPRRHSAALWRSCILNAPLCIIYKRGAARRCEARRGRAGGCAALRGEVAARRC